MKNWKYCWVCHEFKKRLLLFKTKLILELILKWTSREIMYMCAWWRAIYSYFSSFFKCIHLALCNGDANGNVPLGKSCNRYWNCQGGYPRRKLSTFFFCSFYFQLIAVQRCPAQLVFDKHSLRCVVPPTEECDVIPAPAPEESEQGSEKVIAFISTDFCLHILILFLPSSLFQQRNEFPNATPPQFLLPAVKQVGRPRN